MIIRGLIMAKDKNGNVQSRDLQAYLFHQGTNYQSFRLMGCHCTKLEDGKFLTAGGRVLGVTATGEDLKVALDKAYKAVDVISFEKAHYRKDIGKKALK